MARIIGEAGIEIEPETGSFSTDLGRDLERDVRDAARGVNVPPIEVGLEAMGDELRRDVRAEVAAIQRTITAEIPMDADGVVFREQVARAVQQVEDAVSVDLPVEPAELGQFATKVRAQLGDIRRVVNAKVPVEPELDEGALRGLRGRLQARVRAISAGLAVKIGVDVDRDRLAAGAAGFGKLALGAAAVITAGAGAASALSALGPVLAVLVGLVGQLSGGLVVLPGLLAGLVGIVAGLKIGFSGMGDAISNAFDPANAEKFNEAMAKLAPSAQEVVRSIQSLGPAWDALRLDVQQQLFENLGQRIAAVGNNYLPILRDGLRQVTAAFNMGTQRTLDYLNTAAAMSQVTTLMQNTGAASRELGRAMQPAIEGLLVLVGVGSGQLPGLAASIADVAERFRDWAVAAEASGRLQQLIDGAKLALVQLGQIAGNIGTVLGAMWEAAGANGAGALASFVALTDQMAAFVQSAEGMTLLTGIFSGLSTAAGVFRGILGELLPALAPIAEQLPTMFANAGPGLIALAAGIGSVLRAAAPLVPVIGTLVGALGSGLGTVLQLVAPLIGFLASALGFLGPVLGPVVAGLAGFAGTLAAMVGVILAVSKVIAVLKTAWLLLNLAFAVSPIGFVIALVVGLVAALVYAWQNFEGFRNVVTTVWNAIVSAGQTALDWIMGLPGMIGGALAAAGAWFAGLGTAAWNAVLAVGTWLMQLPALVGGWLAGLGATIAATATAAWTWLVTAATTAGAQLLAWLAALPGMIAYGLGYLAGLVYNAATMAWNFLWNTLPAAIAAVGAWLVGLPAMVGGWLAALGAFVAAAAGAAWNWLVTTAATAVAAAIVWVAGLPGRVGAFLASLGATVAAGATAAWTWLLTTVVQWGSAALAWVGSIPGRVGGFLAALPGVVMGAASRAWSGFLSTTTSLASSALGFIGSLPGRIMGFFAGAGSWLVAAGRAIIQGLWNGLKSMAQGVLNYISDLAGRVAAGFKNAIGIASPSKVFARFGVNIGEGLLVGLGRIGPDVIASARELADQVRAAAEPRLATARVSGEAESALRRAGIETAPYDPGTTVRPRSEVAAQAPDQTASAVGDAVYRALNGARMEVSGSGLAKVVARGQRENDRR